MSDTNLEDAFRRICASEIPLSERLNAFSEAVRRFSLPFANVYDDLVIRIRSGDAGFSVPKTGERMPPFALPDRENRLLTLDDLLREGPAVVSFNRGHWCEYCLIELAALRGTLNEFARRGARVVSIMPEIQTYISEMADRDAFTILSDIDNGYALELGLAIWLGDDVRKLYLEHGLELQKYNANDTWFLPIPATFVIGEDGIIIDRFVDPDFRNRMEIANILSALDHAAAK
ncbi:MAG: peroxiredoxin-like family protein [Hyphomicrobium sp.]|uniref:peroxiredoxin-like family protein n=1 Tax=Hyphomicrobium sp. TaxID=82 RepID=UPI0039E5CEAE